MADSYPPDEEVLNVEYDLSDHDLLIEINVRQKGMEKQFSNHLRHRFLIAIAALSAGFAGSASFIVGILLLLFRKGI